MSSRSPTPLSNHTKNVFKLPPIPLPPLGLVSANHSQISRIVHQGTQADTFIDTPSLSKLSSGSASSSSQPISRIPFSQKIDESPSQIHFPKLEQLSKQRSLSRRQRLQSLPPPRPTSSATQFKVPFSSRTRNQVSLGVVQPPPTPRVRQLSRQTSAGKVPPIPLPNISGGIYSRPRVRRRKVKGEARSPLQITVPTSETPDSEVEEN